MNQRFLTGVAAVALLGGLAAMSPASAQAPAPAPAPTDQAAAPAAPTHLVWNGITLSGHVEGGTNINPDSPDNNINFGQLFTDRANSFRMNQANLAAEQDIDSSASTFNYGWRVEGMYGTDSRFTHTFGLFDRATNSPYQWDLVEGSLSGHFPVPLLSGGLDVKGGIYPTPIGYEVIDATGNFFYTHSYIFNFGIPLKHTGVYATAHVLDLLDLWAGVDTGVNSGAPFFRATDNNHTGAVLAGFGINNPIPNLTILGLAHIGPENGYVAGASCATGATFCYAHDPNAEVRQIYDMVTTWKVNDNLTVANELNYIRDDLFHADAGGASLYGIYKWDDQWSFGARGEVFRDDQGFFVTAFQESSAFLNAERGIGMGNTVGPLNAYNSGYNAGKASYSELTLGANWTPAIAFPDQLPSTLGLTLRPEFRWDHAWGLNPGMHPFDVTAASAAGGVMNGTKDDQILLSIDAILAF